MTEPKRQYTIYLDKRQQRVVETLSKETRRSISDMVSYIIYDTPCVVVVWVLSSKSFPHLLPITD